MSSSIPFPDPTRDGAPSSSDQSHGDEGAAFESERRHTTPSERVTITIEHDDAAVVDSERLSQLVTDIVAREEKLLGSVNVVCGDHELIRRLNREYLEHDYNTDVLSFSLAEASDAVEGEVYVDIDTAHERHGEFGEPVEREVARYVVHGVLHLCGYDDATEEQASHMHELEDRYLSLLPDA